MKRLEKKNSLAMLPSKPTTTYGVGLLQNKAFRILKERLGGALKPFDITPSEWGLLGLLFEARKGLHAREIAQDLDVEAPLITRMIHSLEGKGLVQKKDDKEDGRAQNIFLTKKGTGFVETTEKRIFDHMNLFFSHATTDDVFGYVRTLETIVRSSNKK